VCNHVEMYSHTSRSLDFGFNYSFERQTCWHSCHQVTVNEQSSTFELLVSLESAKLLPKQGLHAVIMPVTGKMTLNSFGGRVQTLRTWHCALRGCNLA
jgi:hypothetical protein